MKKILSLTLAFIMVFALCAFVGCSSQKSDYAAIKKSGKLIIGITIYDPMNYYDADGKTLIGFDTEFAKAVCEKLGVEPEFQEINWDTKEATLKAGNIDCIWNGLTVTDDRRENMDFTNTYLTNKQVVVINKKDAEKYTDTASLANAMLQAETESAGETAIKADANLKNAKYTPADKQQSALTNLLSGNCDAIVIDYTLAKASCGKGDFADFMIVESINLSDELYAIGFRLGSDMTAKVNGIIAELVSDGTLAKIAEKYDLTELYNQANKK